MSMRKYIIKDYHTGQIVAEIIHNPTTNTYQSILHQEEGNWNYPIDLFGYNRDWESDTETCIDWLKNRVIPQTRQNLRQCLDAHNIACYDYDIMMKLNKGRCTDDNFEVEIVEENNEHTSI